jgi:hypothetical protein
MGKSGVMPMDYVESILNRTKQLVNIDIPDDDIVDAEVVEEESSDE